jgi:O-antigen/teichoic acid export membrane protein
MAGIRTLAGDTMIYGLSTFATRMLNYLMVPYLTRVMTAGEYGVVTDLYSLIPFALVVLTMGLESGYFRFAGKATSDQEKRAVFSTTWGATILAAVAFLGLVVLFSGRLAGLSGYATHPSYIWLTGLVVMLDVVTAMPFARLREQRQRMRYVGVRLASVVVNLALCLFFYSLLPVLGGELWSSTFGAGYVLVANVVASAVSLAMLVPTVWGIVPRIQRDVFRRVMLYSLPLLISGIAGTGNEFIDRQMIKWLVPAGEAMGALGVYGATTKLAVIMILFTQMYRLAAEPFFLARFKKSDFVQQTAEAMKYYGIVAVAIFLGVTLFSDVALLILGRAFREGGHLLPMLLVANALAGVVLNLSFWYKQQGRTWMAIIITGTGLIFTVSFNLLLVPRMGYEGAAWARLICEGAMVAVSLWLNQRFYPTPYNFGRIGLYVAVGAVLWGASLWTAGLAEWLQYSLNALMLTGFFALAAWREGFVRKFLRQ